MILETERLILKPWSPDDAAALIQGLNDLAVSRWLARVPYPYSQADAQRFLTYCQVLSRSGEDSAYEFAIARKADGSVVGGVALDRIDRVQGAAGDGIWLNTAYHGQKYGSEAFGRRRKAVWPMGRSRMKSSRVCP